MFRILVAEESAIAREGLKQILAGSRDTVASGEASNAQDVFSQISRNSYDVVLLDTSIPGRSWLDIIKELKSQNAHLPVLVLSSHVDEDEAMRAFRAGASGYLTKACTPDELLTAVRKISNGGKYVSASLGERLASELVRGTEKPPHELLSDREYQVMGKLALGRTVSEIANEMSLSVKTISTYRSRVLEKLNLKNNVELAHYYTQFVDIRTVRCQKCGQENPQVVRYCAFCGAGIDVVSELPQSTAGPAPEVHKQRASFLRKPQWFAVTLAIIGVAAGVIVWRVQSAPPSGAVPDETGVPADGTSIALPKALELQHDDGQAEIYVHADSGGYLVHFSPPFVPFVINRVRMNGAALPSERPEFTLQLWDQDRKVIYSAAFPSTLFPAVDSPPQAMSAAMWVEIPVPGIEVQSDFYAHVLTGSRPLTGVFIGADDSAKNEHSGLTRPISEGGHEERQDWPVFGPGSRWATRDNVNWMIRVVGGYGGGSKPFSSGGQSSPASTAANSTSIATPARPLPSPDVFMKGMTFADWKSFDAPPGLYSSPMADKSLENLADTGANWISLVVSVTQETIASTKIFRTSSRTATDAELRRMVDLAHNLGMRVLLEPRVSVAADLALGQGNIGTAFVSEAQWQEWFASYREMIDHYAAFSQEAGVDALAIGAQLGGTIHREEDWRRIAANVRQRYQGPITYYPATGGTSGDDARIKWWDALDYISVFAFYPLTDKNSPTLVELEAAWTEKGYLTHLESLAKQFDRPVILRLMYLSTDGAAKKPNVPKGSAPVDIQEQADLYQAALEVLWGKPWLKGIFWWQWWVTQIGGPGDGSETPYGKSAEDVLKKFYSQPAPTVSNSVQKAPGQTEAAPTRPLPLPDAFMKGFNFTDWKNFDAAPAQWGLYRPPQG
ncbi:MAG: response regulator [Chloroflexi bacterium]|nr:response regulator [Chloroflexota bacterium]